MTLITVVPGAVAAVESTLYFSYSPVVAGQNNVYKIQPKDAFSNVVIDSFNNFELDIVSESTSTLTVATMSYIFGLYDAQFVLTLAGLYQATIKLN